MAKIISRIVLTGGPCAGKTSALSKIEQYFEELGYKVIIVPESATTVINGGIRCFGTKALDNLVFQRYIMQMQLQNEAFFESAASEYSDDTKCIVLYDRGLIDGNAYINDEGFNYLLQLNNLSRIEALDRYDMVLHLVTAADGAEKHYTLNNNGARTETIEEARQKDRRTMEVWSEHSNLHIIDNSTEFIEKINRVINSIAYIIGNNLRTRVQRKYLVDISNITNEFFKYFLPIDIEQTYIMDDEYERRIRRKTIDGVTKYYYTIQKQDNNGKVVTYSDKKISEREYLDLLKLSDLVKVIHKTRYSFVYKKELYKLDIFEDGLCILETNENSSLILPSGIEILSEITNNPEYYNINMAKILEPEKKLIKR